MAEAQSDELIAEGLRLAESGDRAGALAKFAEATQADPRSEHAWLLRSKATDDPQEAAECLEQALSLNPKNLQSREDLTFARVRRLRAGVGAPAKPADLPWWVPRTARGQVIFVSIVALVTIVVLGTAGLGVLRVYGGYLAVVTATPISAAAPVSTLARLAVPTEIRPVTPTIEPTGANVEFVLRTEIPHSNCSVWFISGHVRDRQGNPVNGVRVRAIGPGVARPAETISGRHPTLADFGYWEFVFAASREADGQVLIVNDAGGPVSALVPFHLTAECQGPTAANWVEMEFVSAR